MWTPQPGAQERFFNGPSTLTHCEPYSGGGSSCHTLTAFTYLKGRMEHVFEQSQPGVDPLALRYLAWKARL